MNKDVKTTGQELAQKIPAFDSPYIKAIQDQSDDFSDMDRMCREFGMGMDFKSLSMARMCILFHNNYVLSVIRGENSYGGLEGLYEIAVYHPLNGMTGEYFNGHDNGADVLGHLDIETVQSYINKIGELPFIEVETDLVPINTKLLGN